MIAVLYSANNLSRPAKYLPLAFILSVPVDMEQKDLFQLLLTKKPDLFKRHSVWGNNVVLSYDVSSSPAVVQEAFERANVTPVFSFEQLRG